MEKRGGGRVLCNEVNEAASIHRRYRAMFRGRVQSVNFGSERRKERADEHGQGFTKFLPTTHDT